MTTSNNDLTVEIASWLALVSVIIVPYVNAGPQAKKNKEQKKEEFDVSEMDNCKISNSVIF